MKHVLFWIFLFSGKLTGTTASVSDTFAINLQPSGLMNQESIEAWAKFIGSISSMESYTICHWTKLTFERDVNQLWSYCEKDKELKLSCHSLAFTPPNYVLNVGEWQGSVDASGYYREHSWNFICITVDSTIESDSPITIMINGQNLNLSVSDQFVAPEINGIQGLFVIGQDQETFGGGYEKQESLSGRVALLNVWDYPLEPSKIQSFATCQEVPEGNSIAWKEESWEISKAFMEPLDARELCRPTSKTTNIVFPNYFHRKESISLCHNFEGTVLAPKTAEENQDAADLALEFRDVCGEDGREGKTAWLGIERGSDGSWFDLATNQPLNFTNFSSNKTRLDEHCAFMFTSKVNDKRHGKWGTTKCRGLDYTRISSRTLCSICHFDEGVVEFTLKGLCLENKYDRVYYLEKNGTSLPYFKGRSSSIIYWDEEQSTWILSHLRYNTSMRLKRRSSSLDIYPIGRRSWTAFDTYCTNSTGQDVIATLSRCKEDQFTCSDGSCLPLENRCDLKSDCLDKTDEEDCKRVLIPADYISGMPPKQGIKGSRDTTPLELYLGLEIVSFDQIRTMEMSMSLMLKLNLTWRDRRLNFLNLRDDIYLNSIGAKERSELWIPEIGFTNAKTGPLVKDEWVSLLIRKDADPLPYDETFATENNMYFGHDNSLMYFRRYHAEYHCTFNLRFFPFDKQRCLMMFKMRTATKKTVQLIPQEVIYTGPKTLVEFLVTEIKLEEGLANVSRSELWLVVQFQREYMYHLSRSFFQSFLLSFLAYLTFWIDINNFSDRFIGSLTCLLVLASLMTGMTESLPNTSYFKAIDVWLLFFLLVTALNIAIHIFLDIIRRREIKKELKKMVSARKSKVEENGFKVLKRRILSPIPPAKNRSQSLTASAQTGNGKALSVIEVGDDMDMNIPEEEEAEEIQVLSALQMNKLMKIIFPIKFFLFLFLFALAIHFKFGDIEELNKW